MTITPTTLACGPPPPQPPPLSPCLMPQASACDAVCAWVWSHPHPIPIPIPIPHPGLCVRCGVEARTGTTAKPNLAWAPALDPP